MRGTNVKSLQQWICLLNTCCSSSRLNFAFRVSDMLRRLLPSNGLLACFGVATPFVSLCKGTAQCQLTQTALQLCMIILGFSAPCPVFQELALFSLQSVNHRHPWRISLYRQRTPTQGYWEVGRGRPSTLSLGDCRGEAAMFSRSSWMTFALKCASSALLLACQPKITSLSAC